MLNLFLDLPTYFSAKSNVRIEKPNVKDVITQRKGEREREEKARLVECDKLHDWDDLWKNTRKLGSKYFIHNVLKVRGCKYTDTYKEC